MFSKRIGAGMSPEEYDELCLAMKEARESSKQAREEFQAHIEKHHCTFELKEPD